MLDASGLIHLQGQYFLVAEDEVDRLRVFEHVPASRSFRVTSRCVDFGAQESDFESIAYDPESDYYFVIGSHGADYSKKLLRFKLRDFAACEIAEISFEPEFIIGQSQINIEALSIYQGSLLIGYRSPSVNDKAVATLFNPDNNVQLLTTFDLHNRVFRDMVCIDAHNYLLLAGPERGGHYDRFPSCVFWWNGDLLAPDLRLCNLPLEDFRAESICIRTTESSALEIYIGSDESKTPDAHSFRMVRASVENLSMLWQQPVAIEELKVNCDL